MQTKSGTSSEHHPGSGGLEAVASHLADELEAARAECRRLRRRFSGMAIGLAILAVAGGWSMLPAFSGAETRQPAPMPSPIEEQRVRQRAELLAMLPADKQRELETFEREVDWVSGYMQTWDADKAGAVVAIMLFRMARDMDHMASMEQQMRAMSGQMAALPAIVAELNQINAKMSVITATLDSTMGRAGRMMPWMPFSP